MSQSENAGPLNEAITAWVESFGPVKPFALPIPETGKHLRKGRSGIYECIGRGDLQAVKDGGKTLIIFSSIVRYLGRLPPAKIKPPTPSPSKRRRAAAEAAKSVAT